MEKSTEKNQAYQKWTEERVETTMYNLLVGDTWVDWFRLVGIVVWFVDNPLVRE